MADVSAVLSAAAVTAVLVSVGSGVAAWIKLRNERAEEVPDAHGNAILHVEQVVSELKSAQMEDRVLLESIQRQLDHIRAEAAHANDKDKS